MARLRIRRLLLGGYLLALIASHLVRWVNPYREAPAPDERLVTVALTGPSGAPAAPVAVAIRDRDSAGAGLPVILLHGSPGDNGEVRGIGEALAGSRRTIAPDLPGFGGSSWRIPDYSIEAHARYVLAVIDSLRLQRVHVLGFSMGGGVALHLADMAPDRIASVTLLSAIGAQEYELLGDYYLNHAIHLLQWGLLGFLREGVPHFGAWDGGFLTVEYARNFTDTDQRPLRGLMARYSGPALILQGDKDALVDPAVATESHRLIPQSELAMFRDRDATHFLAFQRPDTLARLVAGFYDRVEAGRATTRASADPSRVAASREPFDRRSLPPVVGVALGVLLLLLAAATFVSEDLASIAAGLLVGRGTVSFLPATIACLIGIFLGDLWLYFMGRWLGRPALRRAPLRWLVSEAQVERSRAWFAKRGASLILLTRFLPGTRLPTYLAAGILRTKLLQFLGAFALAAILWTPLLVGASAVFGDRVLAAFTSYQAFALPTVLLTALALAMVVKLVVPLFSWRGRRLLLSRWRRLTRWEFWPRWAFYPPVVLHVLWLAIRHRGLRLISAVNPAIPGGGLIGESKAEILAGLAHAPDRVARWRLLPAAPPEERSRQVEQFRREHGLSFPIVLKPDVGERGDGVGILGSDEEVARYLAMSREALVVQEYVPGIEFGIFYYRIPGEARGQIFAITDKRMPLVVGDGTSTLERLILADDRAVAMARFFLARHVDRLDEVPASGETVPLATLGTHCRGAIFLDGGALRTPALEAVIDELSQGYQGFWFGRYDIRVPSVETLRAGTDFKVLELNGATSEATSIYDPQNKLSDAYRVLRRQWAILFEIAARNRAAGARPYSWGELARLFEAHRRASHAHVEA
jgi:pimeloyl-ACP methyl ester carboxylesterase/membrane protein DedA with SNARE-associated domain